MWSCELLRFLSGTCAELGTQAKHPGCRADITLERLRQMALMREAALQCHQRDRHVGVPKEVLCKFDTLAQHKLVRAFAERQAKQPREVIGAEANLLCQCFQIQWLRQMRLNIRTRLICGTFNPCTRSRMGSNVVA